MKIASLIKTLGQNMLDLVFPVSCLVCGTDGVFLCEPCAQKLPKLEKQRCIVCVKPSPFGKTHPECVTKNTADGMISTLTYKDQQIKKIIETFKYQFVSDLARPLAKLIAQTIQEQDLTEYFQEFILVPVPLHTKRHNWRGFNQSFLLAQALADNLGLHIDNELVVRSKFTRPQIDLKLEERKKNLDNAFSLIGNPINKSILLIDDVVTSGSTANELAKLLKRASAKTVWVTSVAHG